MLTDWARRAGGGTKALGGVTELGKNWIKRVCVHVMWRGPLSGFVLLWSSWLHVLLGVILSTKCPPPISTPSLFLPCEKTEQQPVLCADYSPWVLCLWMLARAMCCVVHIKSVSSVNTLSVYGGFMQAVSVCLRLHAENRLIQWFSSGMCVLWNSCSVWQPRLR